MVETGVVKDLGNGCLELVSGRMPEHLKKSYQRKGTTNIWCRSDITYRWQRDGTITYNLDVPTPAGWVPTDKPRNFRPAFPACKHLHYDIGVKPCGRVTCVYSCLKLKRPTSVSSCNACDVREP